MYYHRAYDLSIESDVLIPDFPETQSVENCDVSVKLSVVPEKLDGTPRSSPGWQGLPQQFLMDVPDAGRYYVRDGNQILIERANGADDELLVLHLVSSIFAVLLQQRGLHPLHAGSVVGPFGCIACVGPSGIGKSTITSTFLARGCKMISDDITALRKRDDGILEAIPSMPRTRLWQDSVPQVGRHVTEGRPVRTQISKYSLPVDNFASQPEPLTHLFVLSTGIADTPFVENLPRAEAFSLLRRYTFRKKFMHAMGMDAELFSSIDNLLKQVKVMRVVRAVDRFQLDEMYEAVMSAIEN